MSELATNAVRHARTPFEMAVTYDGDVVRVEVEDGGPGLPHRVFADPRATSGRGLALVATLSRGWGIQREGRSKVVWFEVPA